MFPALHIGVGVGVVLGRVLRLSLCDVHLLYFGLADKLSAAAPNVTLNRKYWDVSGSKGTEEENPPLTVTFDNWALFIMRTGVRNVRLPRALYKMASGLE